MLDRSLSRKINLQQNGGCSKLQYRFSKKSIIFIYKKKTTQRKKSYSQALDFYTLNKITKFEFIQLNGSRDILITDCENMIS